MSNRNLIPFTEGRIIRWTGKSGFIERTGGQDFPDRHLYFRACDVITLGSVFVGAELRCKAVPPGIRHDGTIFPSWEARDIELYK